MHDKHEELVYRTKRQLAVAIRAEAKGQQQHREDRHAARKDDRGALLWVGTQCIERHREGYGARHKMR